MATIVITPAYEPGEYIVAMMNVFTIKRWADAQGLEVDWMKRMAPEGEIRLRLKDSSPLPTEIFTTEWINGVPVTVTAPPGLNRIKGFIYHQELEYTNTEELEQELAGQGVVKVQHESRAGRAVLYFNRGLTPKLPEAIILGWDRVRVKQPKPQPRRCYNCQSYGHVAAECHGQPICPRCAKVHDEEERNCRRPPRCAACGGPHTVYSRNCEVWEEECVVAKIRHTEKLSYRDALRRRQEDKREEQDRQEQEHQDQEDQEEEEETTEESTEEEEDQPPPRQRPQQAKTPRPETKPDNDGWKLVSSAKKRKT